MDEEHASRTPVGSNVLQRSSNEEHASRANIGSKVIQYEISTEAKSSTTSFGSHLQIHVPSKPRKVARKSNVGSDTTIRMPQIEIGMRGEFYYLNRIWCSVEIVDSSSPSSQSTQSNQGHGNVRYVVNYLSRNGRRTKDHTENVPIEWLRGIDCSSVATSTSSKPQRVYAGMLSKCWVQQSSNKEDGLSSYKAGYVTKVLAGGKIEFKFFDSSYPEMIAKTTDLLFVSAPSLAGSAVTSCDHAQSTYLVKSKKYHDEGRIEYGTHVEVSTAEPDRVAARATMEPTPMKSTYMKTALDTTPKTKKQKTGVSHSPASIELDGHPICSICLDVFTTDQSSFKNVRESKLPVSSTKCSHRVCCGCLTRWQNVMATKSRFPTRKMSASVPKWMRCPECKLSTAFNAVEMKVDTLLCACLNKISRQDATIARQEAEITRLKSSGS
jgi:hypothetical protein